MTISSNDEKAGSGPVLPLDCTAHLHISVVSTNRSGGETRTLHEVGWSSISHVVEMGSNQLLRGVEEHLQGMRVGSTRHVTMTGADAAQVDPAASTVVVKVQVERAIETTAGPRRAEQFASLARGCERWPFAREHRFLTPAMRQREDRVGSHLRGAERSGGAVVVSCRPSSDAAATLSAISTWATEHSSVPHNRIDDGDVSDLRIDAAWWDLHAPSEFQLGPG